MPDRRIRIQNRNAIQAKHQREHEPYEYYKYLASDPAENGRMSVAIYHIPPKKASYPYHFHLQNEEVFYVISGGGVLETPEGERPISAGDKRVGGGL